MSLWDETLYEGAATHYQEGRLPYPEELAERLARAVQNRNSLLDIGCGPGKLTIPLAQYFTETTGADADEGMIEEARKQAPHITWLHARAEELEGTFDVITFAQSFHWMDPVWVRDGLPKLLTRQGTTVHIGATTHKGDRSTDPLPHPRPPYDRMNQLVQSYLGKKRRAGRKTLTSNIIRDDEDLVLHEAGFEKEQVVVVQAGRVWERSEREVASAVLSLSSSTPALFGERYADFRRDLDGLLRETSDRGWFSERQQDVDMTFWRAAR